VGYIVFSLDAPRDAPVVSFPDGQLVSFVPDSDEDYIWPRVADVRFLLDSLAELNESGPFTGLLDLNRIGMFGHSRGGYLSNICAVEDSRIKAAVNMDGFLWGLWTQGTGLNDYPVEFQTRARAMKTPVLRLRGDQGSPEAAQKGFEEEVKDFGGDFVYMSLHGTNHGGFNTTPWMCGQAKDFGNNAMQAPPPTARVELLMKLLGDFFETYLLKRQRHIALQWRGLEGMDIFCREEA
jgi:dienelactone hydrolase